MRGIIFKASLPATIRLFAAAVDASDEGPVPTVKPGVLSESNELCGNRMSSRSDGYNPQASPGRTEICFMLRPDATTTAPKGGLRSLS